MANNDSNSTNQVKEKARARGQAARRKARHISRGHTHGFMDFLRGHSIVGLAIGLSIGTVASGTIKTIVEGFITPIVRFVIGSSERLEASVWHIDLWGRQADLQWGAALSALITLAVTIYVIFLIVKIFKLDKLSKKD